MELSGVALHAGIDPETKPYGELLIFQFEPLSIDQSGLGIDSGHTNTAGGQKGSDLRPELPWRYVNQRPSFAGKALDAHRISLVIGRERSGSRRFKLRRQLGALGYRRHRIVRLYRFGGEVGRHVDRSQLGRRLIAAGVIREEPILAKKPAAS
ncbi:MAG: Uncharacterised protein [Halieaceae bacterium]|nr:MAG: Uncharacterised protein [Halieaceae bacterium]